MLCMYAQTVQYMPYSCISSGIFSKRWRPQLMVWWVCVMIYWWAGECCCWICNCATAPATDLHNNMLFSGSDRNKGDLWEEYQNTEQESFFSLKLCSDYLLLFASLSVQREQGVYDDPDVMVYYEDVKIYSFNFNYFIDPIGGNLMVLIQGVRVLSRTLVMWSVTRTGNRTTERLVGIQMLYQLIHSK